MTATVIHFPRPFRVPAIQEALRADGTPVRTGDTVEILTCTNPSRPRRTRGTVHAVRFDRDADRKIYFVWCNDGINRRVSHDQILTTTQTCKDA